MSPKLLTEEEIVQSLGGVSDWIRDGSVIKREVKFKNFIQAMGFVNQVALLAEKSDHHPDILIEWNQVTLCLSTHSVKGLTNLDFELAQKIKQLI